MRQGTFLVCGLLAGCLVLPGSASAQLYQWRDTNGRVVFSDTPPPPNIPAGNIIKAPKGRAPPAPAPSPAAGAAPSGGGSAPAAAGSAGKTAAAPADTSKASAQKSLAEREADYKKRQADAAEKAQKDEQAVAEDRRREDQCKSLRQALTTLESGLRLRRVDEKGEPYYVDDAERAKDTERIRRDMATAKCG